MHFLQVAFLSAALIASAAAPNDPVYMSAHGKAFHTSRQCMSLAHSQHVYTAVRSEAEAHGMHECSICNHKKDLKAAAIGASAWAKESAK